MTTMDPNVKFLNPEKKPLEELILVVNDDGVNIKVPALHKRWVKREIFTAYIPLVGSGGKARTGAELDEWLYEGKWFLSDMRFLLRLKHFEFWSQVIHQKVALSSVVSFLKNATPFYMDIPSLTSDAHVLKLYKEILAAVVRVVCRIITNKESDEEWISKDHLKELIYPNFLISIPMLFDLIIALGDSNLNVLHKIFDSVFRIEPKYKSDLTSALQYFEVAFVTIQQQAENGGTIDDKGGSDENLDTPYDDLVLFTLDCAFTLSILLEVYPDARHICCDINLAQSITHFYDNTIPYLYKNIYVINQTVNSLKWLNEVRVQFLKAFRSIVYVHIEAVLGNPEESIIPSEKFIGLMTECLADRAFVIDYQREYPLELDVEILKQACKDLDNFKTDFVAKGYKDEADSESFGMIGNLVHLEDYETKPPSSQSTLKVPLSERLEPEGAASIDYDADKPSTSKVVKASKSRNSKAESKVRDIDLEVTSVLDVLPHLGDGFVRRILCRYENSEEAIAAILEQNLPPDLMNADQNEVYIPPDPQDTLYQQTGIKRYNVFDGDKYDVMTQDNPDCIIKIEKGFPNAPQNLADMLDDKKEMNAVRHRYQEYTLVEEGTEYEDEYDDSYDALLESESRAVMSRQMRTTLADIEDKSDEDAEEESDDEPQQQTNERIANGKENSDKRNNFCENPEDIRARYEANRAAKYGNISSRVPQASKSKDVVGAAKGQGQEKQVLVNRHKKDVNKSSRANHNRKAGAAFKRSKGMMS